MPSALAITRSIGVVINPRTRSAFAPTYTVVTCTTAMSLRGYCRTLSERIACKPAIRITRLTTIARTGRLTNKSVNFMLQSSEGRSRLKQLRRLARYARGTADGGCPHMTFALAVFRLGARVVGGLHCVVDLNRGAVAKPKYSGADNLVAG